MTPQGCRFSGLLSVDSTEFQYQNRGAFQTLLNCNDLLVHMSTTLEKCKLLAIQVVLYILLFFIHYIIHLSSGINYCICTSSSPESSEGQICGTELCTIEPITARVISCYKLWIRLDWYWQKWTFDIRKWGFPTFDFYSGKCMLNLSKANLK